MSPLIRLVASPVVETPGLAPPLQFTPAPKIEYYSGLHPSGSIRHLFYMAKASIFAIVLLLTGWCSTQAPTTDVDKAAGQFFQRLNSAQYDLIYNDAAEPFKSQNSKASIQDNLVQIINKGKVQTWDRVSMTLAKEKNAQVVRPIYTIKQDQSATELTLEFIDVDGEWKLLGLAYRPHSTGQ